MEGGMMGLLTSLISGGVGGNIAGALMKDKSLGMMWNTVAGLVGGGLGGQLLGAIGLGGGGMVGNIAGSTVGGAIVMVIVAFVKKRMGKTA